MNLQLVEFFSFLIVSVYLLKFSRVQNLAVHTYGKSSLLHFEILDRLDRVPSHQPCLEPLKLSFPNTIIESQISHMINRIQRGKSEQVRPVITVNCYTQNMNM